MDGPSPPGIGGCEVICCGWGAGMWSGISGNGEGLELFLWAMPQVVNQG